MARRPLPYPPAPTDCPDELTDPGRDSALEIIAVLSGLVLFLLIYVGLAVACLGVLLAVTTSLARLPYPLLWVPAAPFAAGLLLILLNGLFRREAADKHVRVEITEEDQPTFFAFLRRLTDEVGAPMPSQVFVTPDVNAAMSPEVSLTNVFVPPKKNLIVGLGLVNALNLSEFKAVIAHEFGHFSEKTTRMHAYACLFIRVMANLATGQDWLDRAIDAARQHARRTADGSALFSGLFVVVIGGPVWAARKGIEYLFMGISIARLSLIRKEEFRADRIAVSVAGSNAHVHALCRTTFANESLAEAVRHLEVAAQHDLYSRDLYRHHTAAAAYLRRVRKKPRLGLPPVLKRPEDGRDVQVFREDEESHVPDMWSTHPTDFDREENAKRIFVVADEDERSPWELFTDADDLKERLTYRFYRAVFGVKKSVELTSAAKVQAFIDDEHAEVTYDPKYYGSYDERFINPGDVAALNQLVEAEPWDPERIERVHGRLYRDLGNRVEELRDLRDGINKIYRKSYGRPRGRARRRLQDLEDEFETLSDWFSSFDRRAYLVHAHMAKQTDETKIAELTARYNFHLEVQALHRKIIAAHERVIDVVEGLEHFGKELPDGFFEVMMEIFRDGRATIRECLAEARNLRTPDLAHVKKGTRLDTLIFDYDLIREPPRTFVKSTWVNKLLNQMGQMRNRLRRMDFKSLGAILQMQDRLAVEWINRVAPPGTLVEDEPLPELIVVEEVKPKPPPA